MERPSGVKIDLRKLGRAENKAVDRESRRRLVDEAKYHLGYPWPWE
jgi:hypothetical protein